MGFPSGEGSARGGSPCPRRFSPGLAKQAYPPLGTAYCDLFLVGVRRAEVDLDAGGGAVLWRRPAGDAARAAGEFLERSLRQVSIWIPDPTVPVQYMDFIGLGYLR